MGFEDIEEQINQKLKEVNNSLKLKNILSQEEIEEIQVAMKNYVVPSPRGFAHGMWINSIWNHIKFFSDERVYDSVSLGNLASTLYTIGIQNKNIFAAIEGAMKLTKKYGV
jgi:hypothetical protein